MRLFDRNEYWGKRRERGGVRGQGVRMRIKKKEIIYNIHKKLSLCFLVRFEMFRASGDEIGW